MQISFPALATGSFEVECGLDAEHIHRQTHEGQACREAMLKGKRILVVACGIDITKDGIYTHAKSLGVELFLLEDSSNPLAQMLKERGILTEFIEVDMTMRDTILDECFAKIDAVFGESGPDAVVTFWDDAVGLTVRIAHHYGVVTNTIESIDASHDKYASRCKLAEHGLPSPQFYRVNDSEQMKAAASKMSYPAILKPVQGAASIGVSMVESEEQAVTAYKKTQALMEEVMEDGELMGLIFDGVTDSTTTFVLEEYIDGEEVDVDMVLHNGEYVYSNINSDWPGEDGRFIETGISFPAKCNETKIGREFREAALRCCKAIGVEHGVVHVEMKYSTKYGPTLVELNPRMGGGPLYYFHKWCFEVDLVTEHLLIMCGLPSNPPALATHKNVCTCVFLYANKDGICSENMNDSALATEVRQRDHIVSVKLSAKEGDRLHGWYEMDSFPTLLGRIDICVDRAAMEYDEVMQYCKHLQSEASQRISYVD